MALNYIQILDIVEEKLLAQNAKSITQNMLCAYRGENNLKCAVGHLIKDEYYSENFEGITVGSKRDHHIVDAIEKSLDCGKLDIEDIQFLSRLQRVHDGYSPDMWKRELDYVRSKITPENTLKFY